MIAMTSGKTFATLYVRKDWTESGRPFWELIWAYPGADSFVGAYGECSKPHFPTMRTAIAHGEKRFGETAKKWKGHGHGFN